MSYRTKAMAVAALSFAALAMFAPTGPARAADLPPMPKKAKPIADVPVFFVIDDRVTYSWVARGSDTGAFSGKRGGGFDATTAKSVYSFTHFDAWAYGTNFFTISMFKSDHNDPTNPCTNAGFIGTTPASCAGATEFFGLLRSTYGFNEI